MFSKEMNLSLLNIRLQNLIFNHLQYFALVMRSISIHHKCQNKWKYKSYKKWIFKKVLKVWKVWHLLNWTQQETKF